MQHLDFTVCHLSFRVLFLSLLWHYFVLYFIYLYLDCWYNTQMSPWGINKVLSYPILVVLTTQA